MILSDYQKRILDTMNSGEILYVIHPNRHGGTTRLLADKHVKSVAFNVLRNCGYIESSNGTDWVISSAGKRIVGILNK